MEAQGSVSDPLRVQEAQDVWVEADLNYQVPGTAVQAIYYDREVAQNLPEMTDMFKYSSKTNSVSVDPKSAVNFTRSTGTATSYTASSIKT